MTGSKSCRNTEEPLIPTNMEADSWGLSEGVVVTTEALDERAVGDYADGLHERRTARAETAHKCAGYWRWRWFWKVGPGARLRPSMAWTGRPCATGCTVTMMAGSRPCGRVMPALAWFCSAVDRIVCAGQATVVTRILAGLYITKMWASPNRRLG